MFSIYEIIEILGGFVQLNCQACPMFIMAEESCLDTLLPYNQAISWLRFQGHLSMSSVAAILFHSFFASQLLEAKDRIIAQHFFISFWRKLNPVFEGHADKCLVHSYITSVYFYSVDLKYNEAFYSLGLGAVEWFYDLNAEITSVTNPILPHIWLFSEYTFHNLDFSKYVIDSLKITLWDFFSLVPSP